MEGESFTFFERRRIATSLALHRGSKQVHPCSCLFFKGARLGLHTAFRAGPIGSTWSSRRYRNAITRIRWRNSKKAYRSMSSITKHQFNSSAMCGNEIIDEHDSQSVSAQALGGDGFEGAKLSSALNAQRSTYSSPATQQVCTDGSQGFGYASRASVCVATNS